MALQKYFQSLPNRPAGLREYDENLREKLFAGEDSE